MKARFVAGAAVLAALIEVLAADAAVAAVGPPSALAVPAAGRWWQAFDDKPLDGLLARSGGSPNTELAVVHSYIELRVTQARLGLAEQLQQSAARQRALLEQVAPETEERNQWLAAAANRAQHWAEVQQALAGDRDRAEVTLAALTRSDVARLRETLKEGAGHFLQATLDRPVQAPQRLATADVAEAPAPWQALQSAAAQAAQTRRLMQASELELQARQLRQEAGADSEIGVLEGFQRLVADTDRLAAVTGSLALAWAQWLHSTGGPAALTAAAQISE